MLKSKYNIGQFDCPVILVDPVDEGSTSGGPKFSGFRRLSSDPTPYAMWKNKLGNEVVNSDQITHIQQATVVLRFREDISLLTRIVRKGKLYAILSFAESGETRQRFLDLTVEYVKDFDESELI